MTNEKEKIWKINAKIVSYDYGAYVDWNEKFYICPCCGEPVYECDWSENDLDNFICPICKDEDLEEE